MIIILVVFFVNIIWAVINWRNEFDLVMAVYQKKSGIHWTDPLRLIAPFLFLADLGITGTATSIFGFGGFYGSAMAIFMSNILSVVFFTPKGEAKELLKSYRQNKKES